MKKLFLSSLLLLSLYHFLQAQTILLLEDFSTASGTTPPAGWTIQTATGDPLTDVWRFDNPGRREPVSPILSPFAIFDSDRFSDNGQEEVVYLTSPVFNATTADNIILDFDQYFKSGYNGACEVEVFDGTSWVSVYNNSTTTTNPQHSTFDITTIVQNKTNARIRFKWTGNYSWFWIIDNIKIATPPVITEQFTEQTGIALPGVYGGSIAWGDYDNDGDLDILLTGSGYSKIYRNNGDNTFSEQAGISLTAIYGSSVAWDDYDNDGDLDILLTGQSISAYISKIYRNNGDNTFTEQTGIPLAAGSSVAWGDYNNDGNPDILLSGESISKVYRNNGDNTFTEQSDIALTGVSYGSSAWGDYDNDGDLDILLTGYSISSYPNEISKIYRNNGDNTFTEQTGIALTGVSQSSVAWGDYDNDGDLDILLTGSSLSKIYRNNGDNTFTEQAGISLEGVGRSSVAWGDYDNDGNLDILLSGYTGYSYISKIYRNNGDNTFTEQTGITLAGVGQSSVAWGDYNNDGTLDILLTGYPGISKIYKNNNSIKNTPPSSPLNLSATVAGQRVQFRWDKSTDAQTPQKGLSYNLIISSTPGGCNVLSPMATTITGFRKVVKIGNASQNNFYNFFSSLPAGTYYWSVQAIDHAFTGSAFATPSTFTITELQSGFLKFIDITTNKVTLQWTRGNKEKCAVFITLNTPGLPTLNNSTAYNANPVFMKGSQAGAGWYCIYNGTGNSVTVTGLSGSNTYKVMAVEYSGSIGQENYNTSSNTTNPAIVTTSEQFTEQTISSLPNVNSGSIAWGDYDNDGNLDILFSGSDVSKIYHNNGNNSFTEQTGIDLTGVNISSVAWGDYDNDGDLDILLTGMTSSGEPTISKIYRNNGNNSFIEQTSITLTGVYGGSVAWGDYNNDGYLDILLTGLNSSSKAISKIYRNNGNNSFTEQTGISLTGVWQSSVAWGDYDNDGDLDILLTGDNYLNFTFRPISKIYRNNGDNTFTEQTGISLTAVYNSSVAWGDYDNDGNLDILIIGSSISKIYHNNGDNTFTEQTNISLTGVDGSSVAWGDYNNDGNLDILLTGVDGNQNLCSKIYQNNGNNSFTEQNGISFLNVSTGPAAWGDYNNDGNLDILLTGSDKVHQGITKILKNNNSIKNSAPTVPSGIYAYISNGKLNIFWDKASDLETPQNGLTYNLRVGTTPGGCDIFSPMSSLSGKRTIPAMGNAGHNLQWGINLPVPLPESIYYSIQTVDNGFLASGWSQDQSTVSKFIADFTPTSVCQKNEIQFQNKSYSKDYQITSYQWKFIEDGLTMATSTLQSPTYAFRTHIGTHQVELTITNSNGETISRSKSITIIPSPLSDFSALPVCQGTLTSITNTTQSNTTNIISWSWNFGDGTPNTDMQNPGTHSYNPGTYILSLTTDADNGCRLTTKKEVLVAGLPSKLLSITGKTITCSNDNTFLSAENKSYYNYQWKSNGAIIPDSTKNKFYPKSNGSYSVEIINTLANNCITQSDLLVITVKPAPPTLSITGPTGTAYCMNDAASQLSAPLVNGLTYNWMVNGSLAMSGSNIYIPQQSGTYTLIVSNADNCSQVSSNSVSDIIINTLPAIPNVISPTPTFCSGTSFTMETPYSNELTYQWLDNGSIVPGATLNTFSPAINGKYSVKITKTGCANTSLPTDVTVLPVPANPAIIAQGSTEFCQGDSLKLSVTGIAGLIYQWKLNGGTVGVNQNTYLAKSGGIYSLEVKNSSGCTSNSANTINVVVNPKPNVTTVNISGTTLFCQGGNVGLSVTNNPVYTYQWKKNGSDISGATTNIYTAQSSGVYALTISNTSGCIYKTDDVSVITSPAPAAPFISASGPTQLCQGDSVILSVTNTVGYSYQWKLNGGVIGTNKNTFPAKAAGTYSIVVTNSSGCAVNSTNTINVVVNPKPDVTTVNISGPTSFCQGGSVGLSVTNNPVYTYQWKNNGSDISGATTNIYPVQSSGVYALTISNTSGCIYKTIDVNVTTSPIPSAPYISASGTSQFCQGDSVILSVTNTAGYSYQWKLNSGAVGSNQNTISAKTAGSYSLVVTNSSGCTVNATNTINVVVNPKPNVTTVNISGATSFCQGGSVELSVTNNPVYTYQWKKNGSDISGATTGTYTAQNSGVYALTISNTSGCIYKTEDVNVTTFPIPSAPFISASGPTQFCQGDSVVLSVANTAGYTYQWKLNGGAVGTNSYQFTVKNAGSYNVIISNSGGCSVPSSNSINILVTSLPAISAVNLSGPTQFCEGGSITLSIPSTPGLSYNWRNEYGLISGAGSNSYTANTPGIYQLQITNGSGCMIKTSPVSVLVKRMPFKPVITSDNYQPGKCLKETALRLNVNQDLPGYNYSWYKNGVPVSNSTSSFLEGFLSGGDYSVEANLNGCKLQSDIYNVFFADAPEKPYIYAKGSTVWYLACSNDSASQYKWYYNDNLIPEADKYLYVANQNLGNYSVSIANSKGCFTASDVIKIPSGAIGIDDVYPFEDLKIYPNPTSGLFNIEMDNLVFGELLINIITPEGKQVLNFKFKKTTEHFSNQIDLSREAKGIYFISLIINRQISNKKIIIE